MIILYGLKHTCVDAPHIINVFFFSKAYGMMGWQIGYIAYPPEVKSLGAQDNIPICASIIGKNLALYSLDLGPEWVKKRV
jgi:aspartate/methionine/tyrosine aminotransferase